MSLTCPTGGLSVMSVGASLERAPDRTPLDTDERWRRYGGGV